MQQGTGVRAHDLFRSSLTDRAAIERVDKPWDHEEIFAICAHGRRQAPGMDAFTHRAAGNYAPSHALQ